MIVTELVEDPGLTVPPKETRKRSHAQGQGTLAGSSSTATSGKLAALLGDCFYFSRGDIEASLAATTHQLSLS